MFAFESYRRQVEMDLKPSRPLELASQHHYGSLVRVDDRAGRVEFLPWTSWR